MKKELEKEVIKFLERIIRSKETSEAMKSTAARLLGQAKGKQ